MLRIYVRQGLFNCANPAIKEARFEVPLYCRFAGLDLAIDTVPDEITICKFRLMLERHQLANILVREANVELSARGLLLKQSAAVGARLIAPPPSTTNKGHKRDSEMSSTKQGNQWRFGMKAHTGAHGDSGLVHSPTFTKAKVPDNKGQHEQPNRE